MHSKILLLECLILFAHPFWFQLKAKYCSYGTLQIHKPTNKKFKKQER